MHSSAAPPVLLLLTLQCFSSFNGALAVAGESSTTRDNNPFTPKGYLIRYWNKHISNNYPKPPFLLNKASPLTAVDYAAFSKLADDHNLLSTHLHDFCAKANLLCFPDLSPTLKKRKDDVNFASYAGENFTNYGTGSRAGVDAFAKYSEGENVVSDSFRRYSRDSVSHQEEFTTYATEVNMPDQSFNGYGTRTTGGGGRFSNYNSHVNVPNLHFTAYADNANGRTQTFTEYANGANSGDQSFASYGKRGNGVANEFSNYGKDANVMGSTFKNYGAAGNSDKDTFTAYGEGTNVPVNTFKNYGAEGNGGVESFERYGNDSNVGNDDFQSYGKKSNAADVGFENYGQGLNDGSSKFSGYGENAPGQTTNFKLYGVNTTFKGYSKEGVTFSSYTNETSNEVATLTAKGKRVNTWVVEPGKFFREDTLKIGNIMHIPDIRDKMPKRSFLPKGIISKLPLSMSNLIELQKIFHAGNDSSMTSILVNSLRECERTPSPGETKRCVASIEDMIDFSTSVLGQNVTVHTTESTKGYNGNIVLGQVKGINGGKVTKSVSCHQSLFPSMLYYCHSVPKVRVYGADILDPKSKVKINHGVAICHLDTSSWSPGHGAFVALGSGPGKIEVCHWIFENDMTWTTAD